MGWHIHRDAGNVGRKIRPVIEIEAAQEILVRLTVPGMLGHDQSGHHLEHLAWPLQRHGRQTLAGNDPLAAGGCQAFQIFHLGTNFDRRQHDRLVS